MALVSCVLGHSKMGARLWSHRRSSRAARPTPPAQQHSQTVLTPATFTHSVLYVCEGMSGSVGEAMAAARDRATRIQSVQQDTTLGYPYQVSLPDGEERHCTLNPHHPTMKQQLATSDSQEAEITREYIKPPPNKTLFDVECEGPHRSCSMGVFPTQGEWGGVVQGGGAQHHHHHHHHHLHHHQQQHPIHHHHHQQQHRHSASLDARSSPNPTVSAASSSSSTSSWAGWGSGDESSRGSPRRVRKTAGLGHRGHQFLSNCIAPFTSPKNERGGATPHLPQDGSRRVGGGGRHQGGIGLSTGTLLPSQGYCPPASTLADITMLPVHCGPSHSPNYPSGSGTPSQGTLGGSLGVQGGSALPISFEPLSSQSGYSASADDDDEPPSYTDVIRSDNSLYRSVSRHSEQRTNSGKI